MATLEETLRKLGLAAARGVPQLATGFVDLAALPFTMTGVMKPEQAVGSTAYLTSKGLLPPPQEGLLSETAELVSSAVNPATATKAALAKGGLLAAPMLSIGKKATSKIPAVASGVKPPAEAEAAKEKFLESSAIKERLYHATPADFTEFKPGGKNPDVSGSAIWMSPNKEFQPAAHNIRQIPDKPGYMYGSSSNMFTPGTNVMPLYANIKNPLVVTDATWKKAFEGTGGDPWIMPQKTVDILKERGHDGVFYLNKNGGIEEVVAFDPTQVKSAIGNRGTYDVTNPNILAAGIPIGLLGSTQVELPKKQEKKPKK